MARSRAEHPRPARGRNGGANGKLPPRILRKMERGTPLSQAELRLLIELEAGELGLSFEEAVARARRRELPQTNIGTDIRFLVTLLAPA